MNESTSRLLDAVDALTLATDSGYWERVGEVATILGCGAVFAALVFGVLYLAHEFEWGKWVAVAFFALVLLGFVFVLPALVTE